MTGIHLNRTARVWARCPSPTRLAATALGIVALALAPLAGCTSPSPLQVPDPVGVTLEGDTVVWTTAQPAVGSVRFGARAGQYTHVAYPSASGRADRAYTSEHRVRLLSASAGETVYLQVVSRGASGVATVSEPMQFEIPAGVAHPALFTWTMIDVGFGDSHLLTMPNTGKRVLIDAGERRDWPNVDRYLRAAGVTRLDAVLATHIHEDHIGGMVGPSGSTDDGVLGAWNVGEFLEDPAHSGNRAAHDEVVATLTAHGIPRFEVHVGDTPASNAALAWDPDVAVEVLNAGSGQAIGGETEGDWINNDSVILRLGYRDVDLMLGGDAESPVQIRLLAIHPQGLDSEVLKVHHHGVADATEPAYLIAVNPRVGLIPITTYESSYGTLPSGSVLDRLHQHGVDVYASDRAEPLGLALSGDAGLNVTVITDGAGYELVVAPSQSQHWPGGDWVGIAEAGRGGGARLGATGGGRP